MAEGQNTAIIRFDGKTHRCNVRGAVNGQTFNFPTDKDVTVTREQVNALRDSNVSFDIVSPLAGEDADEGSSASSTETGTAFRDKVTEADNPALEKPVPELSQRSDEEIAATQAEAEQKAKDEAAAGPAPEDAAKVEEAPKADAETKTATRAEVAKPASGGKAKGATKPKTAAPAKKAAANK